jgi:hypothetical protein
VRSIRRASVVAVLARKQSEEWLSAFWSPVVSKKHLQLNIMVGLRNTAHFERYVSGIFDSEENNQE